MYAETNENLARYGDQIRPIYPQLFNIAHAICGNARRAEYALQCAILTYWRESDGSRRGSLRDGLRNTLMRTALRTASDRRAPSGEDTWSGLTVEGRSALGDMIASESARLRRMLTLKYGCGLSPARIARLSGISQKRVQAELDRFEARMQRTSGDARRGKLQGELRRIVRGDMLLPSPLAPDFGAIMRAFQADADGDSPRGRVASRIVHILLTILLTLLCIALFWFLAILRQPQ